MTIKTHQRNTTNAGMGLIFSIDREASRKKDSTGPSRRSHTKEEVRRRGGGSRRGSGQHVRRNLPVGQPSGLFGGVLERIAHAQAHAQDRALGKTSAVPVQALVHTRRLTPRSAGWARRCCGGRGSRRRCDRRPPPIRGETRPRSRAQTCGQKRSLCNRRRRCPSLLLLLLLLLRGKFRQPGP